MATIGGKRYWIDSTHSFQGGQLHNYIQPYYGYSLIIDGKSNALTKMPRADLKEPNVEILEVLDISKGPNHPATMVVTTILKGSKADEQRESFLNTSRKKLQSRFHEAVN